MPQSLPDDLFSSDELPDDLFADDEPARPSFGNVQSGGSRGASPSFLDSVTNAIPEPVKKGWEVANKPLTDYLPDYYQPGQQARREAEADPVTPEDWNIPFTGGAKWKGLRQGLNIGAADVISGLSSPLNIATTAATMGTEPLAAAGFGGAARAANITGRALSAPVAAHGASEVVRPDASIGERLLGFSEFAGGAAGTMTPAPIKRPGLSNIKPDVSPELAQQTNQRLLELEHNANEIVKSSPEKQAAFERDPKSRLRELIAKEEAGALGGQELNELIALRQQGRSVDPNLNSGQGDPMMAGSEPYQRAPAKVPKSRADKAVSKIESQIPAEMRDSFQVADDEAPSPNASGESAASGEAMSRQAGMRDRGEAFVVYDKSGVARNLIGPEAVDYQPKPGETYGIKTPRGFVQLNNNGGNVPNTTKIIKTRNKGEYPGFKGQEPGPELGDVTGLRGRLDAATEMPQETGIVPQEGVTAAPPVIDPAAQSLRDQTQPSLMDRIKKFGKEESGEFNPNALEEYLSEPDDLMEPEIPGFTPRIDPAAVNPSYRQMIDTMPPEAIQDFIARQEQNPAYQTENGQGILNYARDVLDNPPAPEPPRSSVSPSEAARQARLEADRGSNTGGEGYYGRGDEGEFDYDSSAYQQALDRARARRLENERDIQPTTSHTGGEEEIPDYASNLRSYGGEPFRRSLEPESDFDLSGPRRTSLADRINNEFPQRPEDQYEGMGKSLDELEASKKAPNLERLGKLIGEDRAGKLTSGETKIDFSDTPLRRSREKKLSSGTIKHWAEWGDNMVNEVTEDTGKPGMHVVEPNKYFPKKLEIEFRDDAGKPLGVLRSDMAGGGISTLAVSSKIGLRRGKVAFAMLKEAFDRGLTEPSGATSDMTKNLIDRVKRLAKSDTGEFNPDVIADEINKLIDSLTGSKVGKAVGKFMKDDSGELDLGLRRDASEFGPEKETEPHKEVSKLADHIKDAQDLPAGPEKDGIIRKTNNAARSMLTTWDLSAPGRQGKAFMLNKAYWTSLDDMVKAWHSEGAAKLIDQSIKDHPSGYFKERSEPIRGKDGKLVIDKDTGLPKKKVRESFAEEVGLDLAPSEEAFNKTLGDKFKKYSGINKAGRAHTAFLNKLRSDQFVAFMEQSKKVGRDAEANPQIAKQFAKFINDGTGRGSLNVKKWKLERNAAMLSDVFFAPKNMSGQIRTWNAMLNPYKYISTSVDPILKRQALKSLFAVAGLGMGVGELARLSGAGQVSNDPSSTDFRKIVVGDTRVDLFGGYQQFPVAAMRFLLNKTTSPGQGGNEGKTTDMSTGKFGMPTRATVAERFFTNRLSPVGSFVWSWMSNREFDGKPFELKKSLFNKMLPIAISDIVALTKEDPKLAAALAPFLLTGVAGTQTYTRE